MDILKMESVEQVEQKVNEALNFPVPFGKNKGIRLGELSPNSWEGYLRLDVRGAFLESLERLVQVSRWAARPDRKIAEILGDNPAGDKVLATVRIYRDFRGEAEPVDDGKPTKMAGIWDEAVRRSMGRRK